MTERFSVRRWLTGATVAAITLGCASASQAAFFPIANFGGGTVGSTDVVFTSDGVGGGTLVINLIRDVSNAAGTTIVNANVKLTTTMIAHSAFNAGSFTVALFNPGHFTITSGLTTLLEGDYGQLGLASSSSGTFSLQALTTNYASNGLGAQNFVNVFTGLYGPPGDGHLSFSATAVTPPLSTYVTGMGRGLNSFTSQLSGNFDAEGVAVVPEPSEWAAMGLGVLGVCGLMVRARRRTAKA